MKKNFLSKLAIFCIIPLALTGCNSKTTEPQVSGDNTPDQPIVVPEKETFSFTFKGTNCSANNLSKYEMGEQVSVKITPDEHCYFDQDVIVNGVSKYQFDKNTGILSLTMTSNVTVTCVCKAELIRDVTFNLSNISGNFASQYLKGSYVRLKLVPDSGYKLPLKEDFQLVNAEIFQYNQTTGDIIFLINDTATITASAIRITCVIEKDLSNSRIEGLNNIYYMNDICAGKIIPDKKYKLPDEITISGDSTLKSYNPNTGEFEIFIKTTCKITVKAEYSPIAVTFDSHLTHCTVTKLQAAYEVTDEFSAQIIAENHYLLPNEIEILGLENGYSYDPNTGIISGIVSGNIEITAVCNLDEDNMSSLKLNLEHCSAQHAGLLFIGDDFEITINVDDDYFIPDSDGLTIAGLVEGYSFDKTTGTITGVIESKEVVIACTASRILQPVSFTFEEGNHCTCTANNEYREQDKIEIKIEPEFKYELPSTYSATGLEDISYDKDTGIFKATITGDATLKVVATKITTQFSYSVTGTNLKESITGKATYGDSVEITVAPAPAYSLPENFDSITGCDDFDYDPSTGKISFVMLKDVNIQLTPYYDPDIFTFTFEEGNHCTCNANEQYYEQDKIEIKIEPEFKYELPSTYSATGLEDISYDKDTGIFKATITGDATLKVVAQKITTQYSYSVTGTNLEGNVTGKATYGDLVEITVVAKPAYSLPENFDSITGCNEFDYDPSTGKISFTILEDVSIKLTPFYDADIFTFTLNGEHVTCNVPKELTEGSAFFYPLVVDELYVLPNTIDVQGLSNWIYTPENGLVSGTVTGDVVITCNCIFNSENYANLVIHTTNCSVQNSPTYVLKDDSFSLEVTCDDGYMITKDSIELVSGLDDFYVSSSIVSFETNSDDTVELNIVAVEAPDLIELNTTNCHISIVGGEAIGQLAFAKITTDKGYILPDTISSEGIEIITYNPILQTMTFRRTNSYARITIDAVVGKLPDYDATMTQEKLNELVYSDVDTSTGHAVWDYTSHDFMNVTSTTVANYELFGDGELTPDNDVCIRKIDYNEASVVYKTSWEYSVLDDVYDDPFGGIRYYYEDGAGLKKNDNASNFSILELAQFFATFISLDTAEYDEETRSYSGSSYIPVTCYFMNGHLAAGLILLDGIFEYVEFTDYGMTKVDDFDIDKNFYTLTVQNGGASLYGTNCLNFTYETGYKITMQFWKNDNYVFDDPEVQGLSDYTFDKETGILTGTITGNVNVVAKAHNPNT